MRGYKSSRVNSAHQIPSVGWNSNFLADDSSQSRLANKVSANSGLLDDPDESPICLNIRGEKFARLVMELCSEAIGYVEQRQAELNRWDAIAKARMHQWFKSSDERLKQRLLNGFESMLRVLKGLGPENFIDHTSENAELTGCSREIYAGANAAVCKLDTAGHRIMINANFFNLPKHGYKFGSQEFNGKDSQLMTLIHEVSHFDDVFGSSDIYYGAVNSFAHAGSEKASANADSIAAYVLGMNVTLPPGMGVR